MLVNPTTIVAREYDGSLVLFRLCAREKTFERVELVPTPVARAVYVCTAIEAVGVAVGQAALDWDYTRELRFVRLNIDDARVDVEWSVRVQHSFRFYHLSEDARFLYGLPWNGKRTLNVFDIEKRTWTRNKLTGQFRKVGGRLHERKSQHTTFFQLEHCRILWSQRFAYISGRNAADEHTGLSFVFRCDLKRCEWTKLPIVSADKLAVSPLVNSNNGDDDGVLILRTNEGRMDVYRLLFKRVLFFHC